MANPTVPPESGKSNLIPFSFEGAKVRVVVIDGEPWFILADVCRVLEIAIPHRAADRLDDDEKTKVDLAVINATGAKINDLGAGAGNNEAWAINESGLYSLILTSRKPEAKRLKKWVTSEVLPSIRKTGGYGITDPIVALNDPESLRGILLTYCERVIALEATVAEQKPKVEVFDRIANADGNVTPTLAAKILQLKPHWFCRWMDAYGWTYKRGTTRMAYQSRINAGFLDMKSDVIQLEDGTNRAVYRVYVTPKGITHLAKTIPEAKIDPSAIGSLN